MPLGAAVDKSKTSVGGMVFYPKPGTRRTSWETAEDGGVSSANLTGREMAGVPVRPVPRRDSGPVDRSLAEICQVKEEQMRRFGIVGVCLAVLAAFTTVSVANAVASEPALYECHKEAKGHGKYSKGCKVEKEGGGYEIKEGIGKGKPFKGKGKGANLEIKGNGGVACTSSAVTGKFTSPKTAGDVVATFKGCEFNGKKCESGSTAGTIVTNPLKGSVGYLEGKGTKTPRVGADISAESGEVLATFKCGSTTGTDDFAVTGSVIGEVTPVNKFTKEATFVFEEVAIGVQKWKKFEEGLEDVLVPHICTSCEDPLKEGFTAESAQETTVVNKGEELMLKA
jgi:hypothetical protein